MNYLKNIVQNQHSVYICVEYPTCVSHFLRAEAFMAPVFCIFIYTLEPDLYFHKSTCSHVLFPSFICLLNSLNVGLCRQILQRTNIKEYHHTCRLLM